MHSCPQRVLATSVTPGTAPPTQAETWLVRSPRTAARASARCICTLPADKSAARMQPSAGAAEGGLQSPRKGFQNDAASGSVRRQGTTRENSPSPAPGPPPANVVNGFTRLSAPTLWLWVLSRNSPTHRQRGLLLHPSRGGLNPQHPRRPAVTGRGHCTVRSSPPLPALPAARRSPTLKSALALHAARRHWARQCLCCTSIACGTGMRQGAACSRQRLESLGYSPRLHLAARTVDIRSARAAHCGKL